MQVDELELPKRVREKFKGKGIEKLNPPQEKSIESGILDFESMVIASPTASGKTLIAEMAFLKSILEKNKKALYIVPLRALAYEKYKDFKRYEDLGIKVAMSVGDFDSSDNWIANYDLIIVTSEKLDSLLRHNPVWMREIGLVVSDEIHLLNDQNRGPTLEVVLTKLKNEINPQILGLSATISNAIEIAEWLDSELVTSDYRPVELYQGVYDGDSLKFLDKEDKSFNSDARGEVILSKDTVENKKQALMFLATRRNTQAAARRSGKVVKKLLKPKEKKKLKEVSEKILSVLSSPTKQCKKLASCVKNGVAFHHAGLAHDQRTLIEESFKKKLIKIICATPTLAAGVDLPAFRVLIRDAKRYYPAHGYKYIPVLEYEQMVGRCLSGDTIIFDDNSSPIRIEEIAKEYFDRDETGKKNITKNLKILSVNKETGKPTLSKVKRIWKRKVNRILEIETKSGKILKVTEDHPILKFRKRDSGKPSFSQNKNLKLYKKCMRLRNKCGYGPVKITRELGIENKYNTVQHWLYENNIPYKKGLLWEHAKKLRKGNSFRDTDHIANLVNFEINSTPESPREFLDMERLSRLDKDIFMTKVGHKNTKFPRGWSPELCRFIAKIMADGNIYYDKKSNSYQIRYYNKDKKIQEEYLKICRKLFGKKSKIKYRRGTYFTSFKSYVVGSFLVNLGIPHGKKSLKLRLPKVIFSLPSSYIKEFLREYINCDGWEEEDRYVIISCSKKFIYDLSLLFSKIGMIPRINKKKPNNLRKRNAWEIHITKTQFDKINNKKSIGNLYPDLIKSIKPIKKEAYVYDLTLDSRHNFVANGIVVHNSGRPRYDNHGESILIGKNEREAEELVNRFVLGEPEEIYSKLSVEPVLRTHVLSLINTTVRNEKQLKDFFSETFFAHQYGDISRIEEILDKIVGRLEKQKFIKRDGESLEVTRIGKRVSELYLDPETAHKLIQGLESLENYFDFLLLVCSSTEIRPERVRKTEMERIEKELLKREDEINVEIPSQWDMRYDDFLKSFKTALILEEWINEKGEDYLMDNYKITPGGLNSKREIADWLLYSCQELGNLLSFRDKIKTARKLRLRIKYGIKKELLKLVKLKGIGRVKARTLYNAGFKKISDLKDAPKERLGNLIGPKTAKKVIDQIKGEEKQKTL